nr:inorganic diphosphatase [endosymbiont of Acanthamoeba sp. UWC8]
MLISTRIKTYLKSSFKRFLIFFENYKSLEKGKWVKVTGWEDVDIAKKIINEAIKRFHETEE